jgi:hypothetical protein
MLITTVVRELDLLVKRADRTYPRRMRNGRWAALENRLDGVSFDNAHDHIFRRIKLYITTANRC